jgi:uncharacterized membrane protein
MKLTWKSEGLSLAMLAAMFIMTAVSWSSAPDRIPVHWGIDGQVDRYGGRVEGLLAAPLIGLGIYLLLLVVPLIDPRRAHYAAFQGPYAVMRTAAVSVAFALDIMVQLIIRGRSVNVNVFVPIVVGALLLIVGRYLPSLKSNWFVGVRTPWTLSSEESWRRTHRLAGWLFTASGVVVLATAVLDPALVFWAIMGTILPAALVIVVYSYFAWRNDPARSNGST